MVLNFSKAFTLIELLVVVAIIGILAAVGVTTFSGFQEKAKINTVKKIHKDIVKFISVELMKCSLGDELILKQIVSQSVVNQADICPKVNAFTTSNNSYAVISSFDYHFKAEKWKNPHNTNWNATSTCTVNISRKSVLGDLGMACIWSDTWAKEIIVGSNVSEAGEKMFSTIPLE